MSEINITGLKELNDLLQTLPAKIEANVLRGALRAGQKPILDAARENINDRTGALSKSLKIKTSNRKALSARLVAGDKTAYMSPHMVESGTAQHFIKPKNRKSLFFAGLAREVVDPPRRGGQPLYAPRVGRIADSSAGSIPRLRCQPAAQRAAESGACMNDAAFAPRCCSRPLSLRWSATAQALAS